MTSPHPYVVMALLLGLASFMVDGSFLYFSERVQQPMITYVMDWLSHTITMVVILLSMTSLFLFQERKTKWIKPLWLSYGAAFIISGIIKFLVQRDRPLPLDTAWEFLSYSFPSTHAAIAFAVVPVLDREFPRLRWFWIIFAATIAMSRVYLGVHFFSDVVWGAILGYIVGYVFVEYHKRGRKWKRILR